MTPVESRTHLMLDVGVRLVEAFRVRLQLVGLERGVDGELRLLRSGIAAGDGSDAAAATSKDNPRAMLRFVMTVLPHVLWSGRSSKAAWRRRLVR